MKLPNLKTLIATCFAACIAAAIGIAQNTTAAPSDHGGGGGGTPPPGTYSGHIVYTASGGLHIFNLATNGDTSLGIPGVNPKYSPDGSMIVYQNSGIWIMSSTAPYNPQQLSARGGTPSFSPDGMQIVYSDSGIWKMNADGTNKTHLTLSGQQPSYSADGSRIAYNDAVGRTGQQLFLMDQNGIGAHQVLTSGAVIDTVWCPGLKVVMGVTVGRKYQLSTWDPSTGTLTTLTSSSGNNFEPSWSPDASHISWTSMAGGGGGIWIMNADGSNPQLVIAGGRQGSWGP